MATVDQDVDASTEDETPDQEESESSTELLAQLGRDVSALALCEAQLAASRHLPQVRRTARDIAGALLAVLASLTAFVFANVAALTALSSVMSRSVAALVLCAAWLVVAIVLLVALMVRAGHVTGWKWWRVFRAGPDETAEDLERARDEAEATVRATLERLGPAITIELAAAVVPMASGAVSGAIEVGDDLMEASEDVVEDITEDIPGGGVVSQMWSVFLTPGRLGLRVATTVMSAARPERASSPEAGRESRESG